MNNRIMAMLFALVAAMFISIVPVKAEAATCKHPAAKVEVVEAKEPTCNQKGNNQYYRCTACNTVYKDAKCTIPTAASAEAISAKGHQWTWAETETGHIQKCTVSGCKATQNGDAHTYTYKAMDGKCVGTCTCGKTVTAAHVDGNSNGWCDNDCKTQMHDLTKVEAKAAECEKVGYVEHYYCEICKGHFTDETCATVLEKYTIDALGHKAVLVVDDEGHQAVCENCEIPLDQKYAHDLKIVDNKDGTHTVSCEDCGYEKTAEHDDGSKKDCTCGVCKAQMEHQLGEYTAHPSDATKHYRNCTVCRKTIVNEKCTFEYTQLEYGQNKHKYECTLCGKFQNTAACFDAKDDHYCDGCGGHMTHDVNAAYMKTVHKAPTCTEDGIWLHYECKTCGLLIRDGKPFDGDKVNPATGHKAGTGIFHDETSHYRLCEVCYPKTEVKIEETIEAHEFEYTALGNKRHQATCKTCGYEPDPADHDFAAPVHTIVGGKDAHKQICNTCKKEVEVYCEDKNGDCVCDVCGTLKIHDITPLSTQKGKDATCTAAGVKTHYKCNTCKNIFSYDGTKCTKITAQDTVIPALGHKWVAKGTDIADGKHVMKCDNAGCNKYTVKPHYTEDGDCYCDVAGCKEIAHSHKHVYVAAVPATCTEEGTEAYYYYQDCGRKFDLNEREISAPAKIPAAGHDFGDEWIPCEDGIHAKFCANCDAFLSEEHNFANGNVLCTVCGGEEDLTHVPAVAATCTQNGNVEYWTSLITGKKYADEAGTRLLTDVTVKATGHDMSGWEDMANGLGHKQVCMNGCGHELVENHDNVNGCFCTECGGFKTGHSNEMVEAVPATCAKAGTQAHFKCSCGKLYDLGFNAIEKAGSIAQLKHDMGTQVLKDAKEGKHYVQCKNCNYRMYEKHGMELSDPNKGNYHQWLCDCGELKIETHYDKNGDKKCDVCGHNMNGASQNTTVEQHDNQTVHTGQSGSVNNTKDWWWNWQEWFTPSNSGGSSATVTESVPESNTPNNGAATGNTTTNNTATNNTANNNPTTGNTTVNNSGNTPAPTVSTPAASETGVIAQFITWFLGLFGF